MDDAELERRVRRFVSQMEDARTAFGVLTALCASSAPMQVDAALRVEAITAAMEGKGTEGIVDLIDGLGTVAYMGFQRAAELEGKGREPIALIRDEAAKTAKIVDDAKRDIREKYGDA